MWDQRYAEPGFAYGTAPNDFLVSVAERIPAGPVLSLGEGEGRNAVFLAGLGHEVTAVDASAVGLAKARALAAERGVRLHTVVGDLAEFVIEPGAWAGIVAIWCHLPAELRRRVHRAAVSGLVPGGAFVLEAYRPAQLALGTGGPRVPELLYSLADLRDDLAGLDLVHAVETEREVHEGKYHAGRSAVVQVLGLRP
jgi:SAM-dependent methyltransferase